MVEKSEWTRPSVVFTREVRNKHVAVLDAISDFSQCDPASKNVASEVGGRHR